MATRWTPEGIPDQAGRVAVVTGANSGLGSETALGLARAGAAVVLACRNTEKAEAAAGRIAAEVPGAEVEVRELDLADFDSVRGFAERLLAERGRIDLLVNNAGVMAPPRRETADGFELQLGTNHLGHFALTGLLLDSLSAASGSRVVTLSSNGHKLGRIDFEDPHGRRRYRRWRAYCQSKLANLLFALELDRRLRAAGSELRSLAAHPGYADTNLQYAAPPLLDRAVFSISNRLFAQGPAAGAMPTLYAATEPGLAGGSYVGPDGIGEMRGRPKLVRPSRAARDEATAERLWSLSEELTGVGYAFG